MLCGAVLCDHADTPRMRTHAGHVAVNHDDCHVLCFLGNHANYIEPFRVVNEFYVYRPSQLHTQSHHSFSPFPAAHASFTAAIALTLPVFMKLPNRRPNSVCFLFLGCLGGLTRSSAAGGVAGGGSPPLERRASPGKAASRATAPGVNDTAHGVGFGAATGAERAAVVGKTSVAGGAAAETGTEAAESATAVHPFSTEPCSRPTTDRTSSASPTSLASHRPLASCLLPRPPRLAQATPRQQQQTCLDGCSASTLSSENDSDDDDSHSHCPRLLGCLPFK